MKQIQIKIYPDGKIEAETIGIKGKKCLQYLSKIEKLADAVIVDSDFTKEYLETENTQSIDTVQEVNA